MDSASALRSCSPRCCRIVCYFQLQQQQHTSEKQVGHVWAVSRTYPIQLNCTDSRPRAWWYQLRALPLVGSEYVCPQCDSSFVITQGSAKPSAFGLPVSQELIRNANRKSGTPVTVKSSVVKCPTQYDHSGTVYLATPLGAAPCRKVSLGAPRTAGGAEHRRLGCHCIRTSSLGTRVGNCCGPRQQSCASQRLDR